MHSVHIPHSQIKPIFIISCGLDFAVIPSVYVHYITASCITISQPSVYNSPSHTSTQMSHHKVKQNRMYKINC